MRRLLFALTLCLALAVPSNAAITGTIVNADGQAVSGAKISIHTLEVPEVTRARLLSATPERPALATVNSDSKGKFSLESPKEAVVAMTIEASGYAPQLFHVARDADRGAIPLVTAKSTPGRITAGGKPVAGARVILMGGGQFVAMTDAEGRYSASDPSKWVDRVVVAHPDYAILNETSSRFMSSSKVSLDRKLDAGSPVTGRVVSEDGKTPVAGAMLTIDNWPAGKSGDDGSFVIAHAPRKWEILQARSTNLLGERARGGKDALVVRLGKTATITGAVRDMKTQAGVAGVEVRVRPSGRFDQVAFASAISDAKGGFTIAGLAPGAYDTVPIRPGYMIPGASVNLAANEKAVRNLAATQLARISGSVLDENKQAVSGARIRGENVSRDQQPAFFRMGEMQNIRSTISAPDGTFVIELNPDADVQINAVKKGYPSAKTGTMRFAPGERKAGVLLSIPLGFEIAGKVMDAKGNPLSGVAVAASESSFGAGASMVRRMVFSNQREEEDLVQTKGDGTFSIRAKEGTYDLSFKREGFAQKTLRAQPINASSKAVEVTLDPGAEVSGRVTRAGQGVEGVRILLIGDTPNTAETGPDGSFRISDLTPGQVMLSAMKPDEFIQQQRSINVPANDVEIEIPPGGRIAGRVVDKETKQPITSFDAGVSASRGGGGMVVMGPPMSRHFTSDDGTFVLENVPTGSTNVVASAPGYTSGRASNVNVEEGKTAADVEVLMDHGVKVTGRVTGPDGAALAGVSVRFEMNTGRMMRGGAMNMTNAVTDANGEYTMEAVEPGEKTFSFNRSGFLAEQKTVELSGKSARVDAQLSSGMRVNGIVVTDGGVPVPDANVTASSASDSAFGGGRSTRTDSNGAFQLEGLAAGRYSFRAMKTGAGTGMLRDFDVSAGAPIRIVMATGGTITGHITGLSADEMQQATVQASSPGGNASGPVDASGNFRIEGAPSGTVRVSAYIGGGMMGGRTSQVKSLQLEAGGSAQVDIEFARSTVRGRISRDGKAAAQSMVMFAPQKSKAQTSARTSTDANGNYEVTGLDDAPYDVQVFDMQRGTPYRTTYEVKGSGTFDIDIKSSIVRGRVLDSSTGQPVEEAAIQVREQGASGPGFAMRTIATDASGGFTLESVPPGTYNLSAEKEGYGTKVVDVTVGDGPSDVEIKLAANPGVNLRVVDARDGRQLSAFVRVMDTQNKVVYESPMRFGGGGAEPAKLPLESGSYRATIVTNGYATKHVTITSPSSPTIAMTPGGSIAVQSKGSALRRARLMGADGREYQRGFGFNAIFTIDPSPGTTTMENIAPGAYTLQILGAGDRVEQSAPVNVMEGQRVMVDI